MSRPQTRRKTDAPSDRTAQARSKARAAARRISVPSRVALPPPVRVTFSPAVIVRDIPADFAVPTLRPRVEVNDLSPKNVRPRFSRKAATEEWDR